MKGGKAMLFLGAIYPMERLRPSRSGPRELKNTLILYVDSSSRFLSTMPSKHTSDDTDLFNRPNIELIQTVR